MYSNFDQHLKAIAGKRDQQQELKDKEETALDDLRRRESNLRETQGELRNNRKTYERNVRERETTVRELAKSHNYPGYDYSPLEENKIVDFLEKLHELVRKSEADFKRVQVSSRRSAILTFSMRATGKNGKCSLSLTSCQMPRLLLSLQSRVSKIRSYVLCRTD